MVEVRAQLQRTSLHCRCLCLHTGGRPESTQQTRTKGQMEIPDDFFQCSHPHGPEVLDLHDMGFSPCR